VGVSPKVPISTDQLELRQEVEVNIIENALQDKRQTLSEHESKEFLRAYGIPVTREKEVLDQHRFMEAVREIGFPLVVKGTGSQLIHKTERALVHVDIRSEDEALAAYRDVMHKITPDGGKVLVQEMVIGKRELVVGLTRDMQFGPCVMFGLGGIFTEILKDISFRVAPIERRDALDMMQEIQARKILEAVRGMPPADLDVLSDILIKVGNIGVEQEHVKEIDMNPVIISGSQPIAVDALVVLDPQGTKTT
jgi:acetyl-CoA synthetase (ADP-forming)